MAVAAGSRSKRAPEPTSPLSASSTTRRPGDELDGRASDGVGAARDFSGWLGLLVAIGALLEAAPTETVEA
ncbi:MAG: hypothetical protein ACXW08_12890 [Solirubrobacteraceae bacterium]